MFICFGFFLYEKKINILNAKARSLSIGREVSETLIERRNEPNTPDNDHYIMVFSDWLSPWMCEMVGVHDEFQQFFRATFDFVGSLNRVLNFKENEIPEQLKFQLFLFYWKHIPCSDLNRFRCNCYPRRKKKFKPIYHSRFHSIVENLTPNTCKPNRIKTWPNTYLRKQNQR